MKIKVPSTISLLASIDRRKPHSFKSVETILEMHIDAYLFSFLAEDVGAGLIVYCCKARVTDRMLHSFQSSVK